MQNGENLGCCQLLASMLHVLKRGRLQLYMCTLPSSRALATLTAGAQRLSENHLRDGWPPVPFAVLSKLPSPAPSPAPCVCNMLFVCDVLLTITFAPMRCSTSMRTV